MVPLSEFLVPLAVATVVTPLAVMAMVVLVDLPQ
jgi:hypothetical protein